MYINIPIVWYYFDTNWKKIKSFDFGAQFFAFQKRLLPKKVLKKALPFI